METLFLTMARKEHAKCADQTNVTTILITRVLCIMTMLYKIRLLPTFILKNLDVSVIQCNVNSRKLGNPTGIKFTMRMHLLRPG
jgi:hypothetical protein